jgi:hypothetical protein
MNPYLIAVLYALCSIESTVLFMRMDHALDTGPTTHTTDTWILLMLGMSWPVAWLFLAAGVIIALFVQGLEWIAYTSPRQRRR